MTEVKRKVRAFKGLASTPGRDDVRKATGNGNFFTAFKNKGMSLTFGNVKKEVPFVLWESIPFCDDTCPIRGTCPHYTEGKQKCTVQMTYIRKVYGWLVDKIIHDAEGEVDAVTMMNIGLRLMPLYGQLIKLKIVEMGIGHGQIQYDPKGKLYIHPVYKEIRNILSCINTAQSELMSSGKVVACIPAAEMNGKVAYYEALMDAGKVSKHKNDIGRAFGIEGVVDDE